MKQQTIARLFWLLAVAALHGCGGGAGSAEATSSSNASTGPDTLGGSTTSSTATPSTPPPTTTPTVVAMVVPDTAPEAVGNVAEPQPAIRRALDTVNPVAASGDVDIALSAYLATADTIAYSLESAGATVVLPLVPRMGAAVAYFPNSPTLVRLAVPATIAPGTYTLKAKGRLTTGVPAPHDMPEATLSVEVNALLVKMATLTGARGSQTMDLKFETVVSGQLYVYPLNRASGTCSRLKIGELASVTRASIYTAPSVFLANGVSEVAHGRYAESDTVCAQFVRGGDSVAEAPYTFNLRWLPRTSGDAVFPLEVDPASMAKSTLSLMSVPSLNWADRKQIYTAGDVRQQTTSSSPRMSLEQSSSNWQYRLTGTLSTDEPAYVGQVEGKPPIVYTLN